MAIIQYSNKPIFSKLVENFREYFGHTKTFNDFYNLVWNVDTAKGPGLDIWGRIVGVGRRLQVKMIIPADYLGFYEAKTDENNKAFPFDEGILMKDYMQAVDATIELDDDRFRLLILLKAARNIAPTTVPAISGILATLFKNRGRCYILDLGGMRARYVFEFPMEEWELGILKLNAVLPRPAGVLIEVMHMHSPCFGFYEAFGDITAPMAFPFDEGTLFTADQIDTPK